MHAPLARAAFVEVTFSAFLVFTLACSDSSEVRPDGSTGGDGGTQVDGGGGQDGGTGGDAAVCPALGCFPQCEHGIARDENGCETCTCLPSPTDGCVTDDDCTLAFDWSACCTCAEAYTQGYVDADGCIAPIGQVAPSMCHDPTCDDAVCGACPPAPSRAICLGGTCETSDTCPDGFHPVAYDCVPDCTTHADCTLAADYGSCCGGCNAAHVDTVADDPCLAESASESECAPSPGSCDGLGCPSPPGECNVGPDRGAVCMADGTCGYAGAGGACPGGSSDDGDVCVPS